MPLLNLNLSAKGLKNLAAVYGEDTIQFVVDSDTYECPFYAAAFISPKIARSRLLDGTITEFVIATKDPAHLFENFLSVAQGSEVSIEPSALVFFLSVAEELENDEFADLISAQFEHELNFEVCLARLLSPQQRERCGAVEMGFLASHFHEISQHDFDRLDIDSLREILSHPSLKISTEDSLFDLISSSGHFELLEYVRFDCLRLECVHRFVEWSRDSFCHLNPAIWASICERLSLSVRSNRRRGRQANSFKKPWHADSPLDGIIAFLTQRCGGNVHDRGLVNVASMSTNGVNHPKHIADLSVDSKFVSDGRSGQWISYEFRTGTVCPSGYAIRSQFDYGPGNCHPKTWVLEISMDGSTWAIVDERIDNYELNGRNVTCYFGIREDLRQDCRFVRLRQTGKTHNNNDYLHFSSLEIFGDFFE
jgi:hypothetical protein